MPADKVGTMQLQQWFTKNEDGTILFTIPEGYRNLPVDFKINLDDAYRPLTQRDAEDCVRFRAAYEVGLDAEAKQFLKRRWINCGQYTVAIRCFVSMGKGKNPVPVTDTITLAQSYARLTTKTQVIRSTSPVADAEVGDLVKAPEGELQPA